MTQPTRCPRCGSDDPDKRYLVGECKGLCTGKFHDASPQETAYDPYSDPEQEVCDECGEIHVGGCLKDRPAAEGSKPMTESWIRHAEDIAKGIQVSGAAADWLVKEFIPRACSELRRAASPVESAPPRSEQGESDQKG